MVLQKDTALLLIDIQQGFYNVDYWGGHRNNPDAEANAQKLLHFWRENKLPIFHVKHCSTNPNSLLAEGNIGNEIQEIVQPLPDEPVIKKNVNSAFIGTTLKEQLDDKKINHLVIAGLTTDHCVSTTTRMAGNLGYKTFLVEDATATFDKVGPDGKKYSAEIIHETAIASLHEEFAIIIKTDEVLKSFLQTNEKSF